MRRRWFAVGYASALLMLCCAGVIASMALAGDPPPGDVPCSHGATGNDCRPDPSTNGQDCDPHGNGGINEDHCITTTAPEGTTVTVTVPVTTTVHDTVTQTVTTPGTTSTVTTPAVTVTAPAETVMNTVTATVTQTVTAPGQTTTITTPAVTVTGPTVTVPKTVTKVRTVIRRVRITGSCKAPRKVTCRMFKGKCHPIARGKG